jgi:hypothetical protein
LQALTLAITVLRTVADSGICADTARIASAASSADAGAGTDGLTIYRTTGLADTGHGTDADAYDPAYTDIYEAGFIVAAGVRGADTGTAASALAHATAATLAESARASAALRLAAALASADSGHGTDGFATKSLILGLSARVRVRSSGATARIREPDARILVES